MRTIIVMLALLMASTSVVAQTIKPAGQNFTINLPAGWVQVPQDVVEAKEAQINNMFPKQKRLDWVVAFQTANASQWFSYPYGGAQIRNIGKITPEAWRNIGDWTASKQVQQQTEDALKQVFSSMNMRDVSYDATNNIIWGFMDVKTNRSARVTGLLGLIQTNEGYIESYCYYLSESSASVLPKCKRILSSITPMGPLAYVAIQGSSASRDNSTWFSSWIIKAIFLGAGIGLLGWWRERNKKSS